MTGREKISHIFKLFTKKCFSQRSLTELISPNYDAKINGIDVFKSNIQIDDYSDEDGRIVHFILLQDHVKFFKNTIKKELSKQGIESLPDKMYFELIPNNEITFPISVLTTNGDYQVDLSWDPKEIVPGSETRFIYTIRDGVSLDLLYNSNFDFIISDYNQQIHKSSESARKFCISYRWTVTFDKIRGTENWWYLIVDVVFSRWHIYHKSSESASYPYLVDAGWWADGQIDDLYSRHTMALSRTDGHTTNTGSDDT